MEGWVPVVGFEGFYEVSDLGRIRSVDRIVKCGSAYGPTTRTIKSTVLKPSFDRDGYCLVSISRGKNQISKRVHRLVLESFVGSCPIGMECLHNDGNPSNNKLSNLSWGTPEQNWIDRRRHGRG